MVAEGFLAVVSVSWIPGPLYGPLSVQYEYSLQCRKARDSVTGEHNRSPPASGVCGSDAEVVTGRPACCGIDGEPLTVPSKVWHHQILSLWPQTCSDR
jgi:hypothetical protein